MSVFSFYTPSASQEEEETVEVELQQNDTIGVGEEAVEEEAAPAPVEVEVEGLALVDEEVVAVVASGETKDEEEVVAEEDEEDVVAEETVLSPNSESTMKMNNCDLFEDFTIVSEMPFSPTNADAGIMEEEEEAAPPAAVESSASEESQAGMDGEDLVVEEDGELDTTNYETCNEEEQGGEDVEEEEVGFGDEKVQEQGQEPEQGQVEGETEAVAVTQSGSNVSEVTYETTATAANETNAVELAQEEEGEATSTPAEEEIPSLQLSSSMSSTVSEAVSEAASISHKLEGMMLDRIAAIDNIRNLLENELEEDNGLLAEFTDKVVVMEQDILSKNECIALLNKHVTEVKAKNSDYAHELTRLSSTINELIDTNAESIERMVDLEQDIATKNDEMEEMRDEMQENQAVLEKNIEDNSSLGKQLAACKAENSEFAKAVEGLQTKNADYSVELETLLSSLKELVEQNTSLEGQVEELMALKASNAEHLKAMEASNDELLEAVEGLTTKLNEKEQSYQEEAKVAQKLQTEKEEMIKQHGDMKASVERMTDDHKAAIGTWEKRMTFETQTVGLLKEELDELRKKLNDEQGAKSELSVEKATLEATNTSLAGSLDEAKIAIDQHESTNSNLNQENNDLRTELKNEKEDKASTVEKLENATTAYEEQVANLTKERDESNETNKSQATTISLLEKGLEDEYVTSQKLKKNLDDHKKKVEKLKAEREELKNSNAATVTKMTEEHDATVAKMTEEHTMNVSKMVEDYEANIAKINQEKNQSEETTTKIAEAHAAVEAKLQSTKAKAKKEKANLTGELTDAVKVIEGLQKKVADKEQLQSELVDIRKQLEDEKEVTAELQGLQNQLAETETHLSATIQHKDDLAAKLGDAQGEHATLKTEIVESKAAQSELLNRVNKLLERLDEKDKDLSSVKEEKNDLTARVAEGERLHEQLQGKYDDMEDMNKKLSSELEDTKGDTTATIADLHERLHAADNELADAKSEIEGGKATQSRDSQAWATEKSKLKKRVKESDRTLVMISTEKEALEKELESKLEEAQEQHTAIMQSLQAQLDDIKEEKIKGEHLHEQLQGKYDDMEDMNKKLSSELEDTKGDTTATIADLHERLHAADNELADAKSEIEGGKATQSRDSQAWATEKSKLKKRVKESDRTLVMLSNEKDRSEKELESKLEEAQEQHTAIMQSLQAQLDDIKEDKVSLAGKLTESEKQLDTISGEKETLEASNAESERRFEELHRMYLSLESDLSQSKSSHLESMKSLEMVESHKSDLEISLENASSQMSELETQKDELEKKLVAELIESKGAHNETISRIQGHLRDTERALESVTNDKNELQSTVNNLEQANEGLSTELADSKSILAREKDEKKALAEEKNRLKKRLRESEKTLVLVANQKTALESEKTDIERKLSTAFIETNGKHSKGIAELQMRLEQTEKHLSNMEVEKTKLHNTVENLQQINRDLSLEINESRSLYSQVSTERESFEEMIAALEKEKATLSEESKDIKKLKQSFFLEKQMMMSRQRELELQLKAPMGSKADGENMQLYTTKADGENIQLNTTKAKSTPGKKKRQSLDVSKLSRSSPSLPRNRIPAPTATPPRISTSSRPRSSSRSRQPLSPQGSVVGLHIPRHSQQLSPQGSVMSECSHWSSASKRIMLEP